MSVTPDDINLEALIAKVAALEQAFASMQLHPLAPIPSAAGTFSSALATVPAVLATGTNGADGVDTSSDSGTGLSAQSGSGVGLQAVGGGASPTSSPDPTTAIFAEAQSSGIYAVGGDSGVVGQSEIGPGVSGQSTNGPGVAGASGSGGSLGYPAGVSVGVYGQSSGGVGVYGQSSSDAGVFGTSDSGAAIFGFAPPGLAGEFMGKVDVTEVLMKSGGGFLIDHPVNPAHKYLSHSFVESPDMKNIYDGVVTLDANGEAEIVLPSWFSALNTDFRYQLTAVGTSASGLYISEEISTDRFKIAGGHSGMKVSWQVTGIRQDAWATAHRIPVEQDKPVKEQGFYRHPELYGVSEEQNVIHTRYPDLKLAAPPGAA
jgi:hypothetical protein